MSTLGLKEKLLSMNVGDLETLKEKFTRVDRTLNRFPRGATKPYNDYPLWEHV